MTVTLDGRLMRGRSAAHDHLYQQLRLPEYYGRNLDALYDILTERREPMSIVLENIDALDEYGMRVMNTIEDAAHNNSVLTLYKKDC